MSQALPATGAAPATTLSFAYDYSGLLLSARSSLDPAPYQRAYDGAGRLTGETRPDGRTVSFGYNRDGLLTGLTWPDGYSLRQTYDERGGMTRQYEGQDYAGFLLASYGYDSLGERVSQSLGNGARTTYAYDRAGQLTDLAFSLDERGTDLATASFRYTRNADGQVARLAQGGTLALGWGGAGAAVVGAHATPANGNNQLTAYDGTALTYGSAGNLADDGINTYAYDALSRLARVTVKATGQVTSYQYDPFGRRSAKTVAGTLASTLYAGSQPIAEYDSAGTLTRRFLYGAAGEPLAIIDPYGNRSFLHLDGQGSVVAVSGNAGRVIETHAYTVEGLQAAGPGIGTSASRTPFGYAGLYTDAESGLTHNQARAYSPRLGRFLQPDPASIQGGLNLYAYAQNDPANLQDPTGLFPAEGGLLGGVPVILPNGNTVPDPYRDGGNHRGLLLSPTSDLGPVAQAGRNTRDNFYAISQSPDFGGSSLTYLFSQFRQDLAQGGTFDYQRARDSSGNLVQLRGYRDVANFNIGLYAQQAGLSENDVLFISDAYAYLRSTFSPTEARDSIYSSLPSRNVYFIRQGYAAGLSGIFGR